MFSYFVYTNANNQKYALIREKIFLCFRLSIDVWYKRIILLQCYKNLFSLSFPLLENSRCKGLNALPLLLLLLVISSGCTSYHPLHLTSEAVEKKLALPSPKDIRIMAGSLDHPVLKPIDFDDRDGLSPDEAAVLAVLVNPSLMVQRDNRSLAGAQLVQAGLLPNPQFSYNINFPTGGPQRNSSTVSQPVSTWIY